MDLRSRSRVQLPLHKIRHGMPGWHMTNTAGGGMAPRKCQVIDIDIEDDASGYWPVKIRYIDRKADNQQGWVNPKHLRFERKYSDLKIDKHLECWHRPTYKGIVLPPQRVVIKEFDPNDPQKNVLISYVDSDAKIFGRQITFREGWINDRDLWLGTGPEEEDALIETLLNEVDSKEEAERKFLVGCSCFHIAEIDGEKTKPLEVTVVERDELEHSAQNCRIQYKDNDYVVGSTRHRLIGGWVSDSSLLTKRQVKEGKLEGAATLQNPRHVINSTWKCVPTVSGEPLEPRKCRVVEKGCDMELDIRIEFLPREGEKYAQIDNNRFLIGGWTSSKELRPCDD